MHITDLQEHLDNPRKIRDSRFQDLIKSILQYPKMLEYRPIVYDPDTGRVLGGNMRHRGLKAVIEATEEEFEEWYDTEFGIAKQFVACTRGESKQLFENIRSDGTIPDEWVKPMEDKGELEEQNFMIKDNQQYGETDWDSLKEYHEKYGLDLVEAGMEDAAWLQEDSIDNLFEEPTDKENTGINISDLSDKMVLKLEFEKDTFLEVRDKLCDIAGTPEEAILKLLEDV